MVKVDVHDESFQNTKLVCFIGCAGGTRRGRKPATNARGCL